jgi:hypothetical protein
MAATLDDSQETLMLMASVKRDIDKHYQTLHDAVYPAFETFLMGREEAAGYKYITGELRVQHHRQQQQQQQSAYGERRWERDEGTEFDLNAAMLNVARIKKREVERQLVR